jgi:hypothetical protein
MGAIAAWAIPLIAQAAGTGLSYLLERGTSVPRIDPTAFNKALKMASQMPSGSTVRQEGRRDLGAQVGFARSQITRLGRDVNIKPQALQEIAERAYSPIISAYIQGRGRVGAEALRAEEAKTRATTSAAAGLAGVESTNIQLGLQEEALRPNPLEMGAMFGSLAANIMNIQSMSQYTDFLNDLFGGGTPTGGFNIPVNPDQFT